jgi:hypothetical protein
MGNMFFTFLIIYGRGWLEKSIIAGDGFCSQGEVLIRDGKCRDLKTIKKDDEITIHTRAALLSGTERTDSKDDIESCSKNEIGQTKY